MKLQMRFFLVILLVTVTVPTPSRGQQAAPEICEDYDRVSYTPIAGSFRADRGDGSVFDITITPLPDKAPKPAEFTGIEPEVSPHATASFFLRKADLAKPDPWNSSVSVFGNKARPIGLRIDFKSHGNGGVRAKWINDKFLSLQVWVGRIISNDLILDIEKGSFLSAESAAYGYGSQVRPGCVNR
jgi:hypothetical protein